MVDLSCNEVRDGGIDIHVSKEIVDLVGKENLLRSFGKNFGCHQSKGVQQWLHHGRVLLIDASPDFLLLPEAFIWDESIGSKNIEKK